MWSPECRDNAGFERPYCSAIFRYGTRWRSSTFMAWCSSWVQTVQLRGIVVPTGFAEVLDDLGLELSQGAPLGTRVEGQRDVSEHDARALFVDELAGLGVLQA